MSWILEILGLELTYHIYDRSVLSTSYSQTVIHRQCNCGLGFTSDHDELDQIPLVRSGLILLTRLSRYTALLDYESQPALLVAGIHELDRDELDQVPLVG